MKTLLQVENLSVNVGSTCIIRGLNLSVDKGEVILLLGPNGSGKSTFLHALIGDPRYRISSGRIIFDGIDVSSMPMTDRVKLGLSLGLQFPPRIKGITLRFLAERILERRGVTSSVISSVIEGYSRMLNLGGLLDKDLYVGFSGGEIKRAELMITLIQAPKLLMLDEPDSGVDVENLALVGSAISKYLSEDVGRSAIIITHTGYIARYVKATKAYVMVNGRIVCRGDPEILVSNILEHGFEKCFRCEGMI
ncbi:MAG: ABC transporter ATP-binding protein [Candidatus Bathyarchaeia archaeon]